MSTPAPELVALSTLLQLERSLRRARDLQHLGFILSNETHRLLRYRQAMLWQAYPPRVLSISGISEPDADAPMVRWLARLGAHLAKQQDTGSLTISQVPEPFRDAWREYLPAHVQWQPIGEFGGLLLARDAPFEASEIRLLQDLADAAEYSWRSLSGARAGRAWWSGRRRWLAMTAALIGVGLIPIRLSTVAPARITPQDPYIITAPMSGVIASLAAQPNQAVRRDDLLLRLQDTDVRNQLAVSRQTLAVLEADHERASQGAFSDPRSKAELALLAAKVAKGKAEVAYLREQLERMSVKAPAAGVAIFGDPQDWIGRPVRVGERIMQLGDPRRVEISIDLAVSDAINVGIGAPVRLFLDTQPLHPLSAELAHADYEAEVTDDGRMVFRLRARLAQDTAPPRIGLRGTARIDGERVRLAYLLFRRPLAALRQWLGY